MPRRASSFVRLWPLLLVMLVDGAAAQKLPPLEDTTPDNQQRYSQCMALARNEPLRALPLVTHAFRAGTSDASWAKGDLPVLPYAPKGTTFHGWTLNYAYAREMSIELMLHPSKREKLGALASTVVFKRVHGRWLIDAFVPSASFAPERRTPRILAQPDFGTDAKASPIDKPALGKRWLLLPASVLLAALLVPVGVGIAHWRRGRRALRAYRLSSR